MPERSTEHESKTISKTDLRQVPGDQAQRRCHGHLREPEAQTETGLIPNLYLSDSESELEDQV